MMRRRGGGGEKVQSMQNTPLYKGDGERGKEKRYELGQEADTIGIREDG